MPARGRPAVEISVEAADFVKYAGRLSVLTKENKAALRKELRAAANKGAKAVKKEALGAPLRRGKARTRGRSTGLRIGLAKSVKIRFSTGSTSTRVGVFIQSKGSALPPDARKLVRRWDSRKPFRHPVYGGPAWATQYGRPYFRTVVGRMGPTITKDITAAMERVKEETMGRPL